MGASASTFLRAAKAAFASSFQVNVSDFFRSRYRGSDIACESRDEPPEGSDTACESLHVAEVFRLLHGFDCLDLLWIGLYALLGDDEAQKLARGYAKDTFFLG